MARLVVIAGPNGSGKSSLTAELGLAKLGPILDPDAVAKRLSPYNPGRAAVAAAREVLHHIDAYLSTGISFTIETTLAGKGPLQILRRAAQLGYTVELVYVFLEDPEQSVLRVQNRVVQGGHDVSDEDIRRRYARSLRNLPDAIWQSQKATIFDNSRGRRRRILQFTDGRLVWSAPNLPAWARSVIAELAAK